MWEGGHDTISPNLWVCLKALARFRVLEFSRRFLHCQYLSWYEFNQSLGRGAMTTFFFDVGMS